MTNDEPQLGCATTGQLLDELKARAEIHGYIDYRTVDDVPSRQGETRFLHADAIATEILLERGRQISEEGYTAESDDAAYLNVPREKQGQLAYAAGAYAGGAGSIINGSGPRGVLEMWPWGENMQGMKIDSARRMLLKSAALAIAQIEQIDREAMGTPAHPMRTGDTQALIQHSGTSFGDTRPLEPHPPGIARDTELPSISDYPVGTRYRGWVVVEDSENTFGKSWTQVAFPQELPDVKNSLEGDKCRGWTFTRRMWQLDDVGNSVLRVTPERRFTNLPGKPGMPYIPERCAAELETDARQLEDDQHDNNRRQNEE
jgi:hypothetical protein